MSLAHAILGLLRDGPQTGYDLKTKRFDRSIAHFWPADQAQVYRTLDKLERDGLAQSKVVPQEGRPDRREFAITAAGKEELARWSRGPVDLPPVRDPSLIQIFFADPKDDAPLRQTLDRRRREAEERLQAYEAIPLPALDDPAASRETRHQRMTLELGIRIQKAVLAWVHDCMAALDKAPPRKKARTRSGSR